MKDYQQTQPPRQPAEFWSMVNVILAHYRRHWLLNLGFIISLALATSTLLSIFILNHASKAQYASSHQQVSQSSWRVVAKQGASITLQDYASLRQQGFFEVRPVAYWLVELKPAGQGNQLDTDGKTKDETEWFTIKATDMLIASIMDDEKYPAGALYLPPEIQLQPVSDNQLVLDWQGNTLKVPVAIAEPPMPGKSGWMDIASAWLLFDSDGQINYLQTSPISDERSKELQRALPQQLTMLPAATVEQRAGFADALHLNLSALALLGFVVSLFIAIQAASQTWRDRYQLMQQCRTLGFSLKTVKYVLMLEGITIAAIAAVLGSVLAMLLVATFLPLLGLTLNQLYQLHISGQVIWQSIYGVWAFGISLFAVLATLGMHLKVMMSGNILARPDEGVNEPLLKLIAVVCLAIWFILPTDSWLLIMISYSAVLLASIAILPVFISWLLNNLSKFVSGFNTQFLLQDASVNVSRRFLPIAAFYLALTTSLAAGLMIGSFEQSFSRYMDKILANDLYIGFPVDKQKQVMAVVTSSPDVSAWYPRYRATAKIQGNDQTTSAVVSLSGWTAVAQLKNLSLVSAVPDALDAEAAYCYVNEPLALAFNLKPGVTIAFENAGAVFQCTVGGVYHDYGNPSFEVDVPFLSANEALGNFRQDGVAVSFDLSENDAQQVASLLTSQLAEQAGLDDGWIYDPQAIKQLALDIFSQTFILTRTIAVLLLALACFGLFLSARNLELARIKTLKVLIALGYSKRGLFNHLLLQWIVIALGAIILAWPVSVLLADALVSKALPASFGWSMPLIMNERTLLEGSIIGLLTLIPALWLPLRAVSRVRRTV